MEAMEVDLPVELQVAGGEEPAVNAAGPFVLSDSGSSTEVDEDEDYDEIEGRVLSRLLPTWAFSQRVATVTSSAPQGAPLRQRLRQGLRVHYPSQTAASFRGFPDFLLRVPAANVDATESGNTTDISESENEAEGEEGSVAAAAAAAASFIAAAADPIEPAVVSVAPEEPQHVDPIDVPSASTSETLDTATPSLPASQKSPGEETEGDICSICFEGWTTAGEHRLSALRCGHLFGYTCIQRWLKSQRPNAKCPQCNKKAKHSEIVTLYAPKLRALDNTEQESLKTSLEQEQSLRRKAEMETAQCKLKLQVITSQYGQAQKELQDLKALMAQSGRSSAPCSSSASSSLGALSQRADGHRTANYTFSKAVLVSQTGGCRVLSYCEPLSCLLASQPSAHATLVPGYGVKKVSVMNMKAAEYVPIHSKQIRGLSFNRQNDSLLLSAALDNTVKLTSLLTNTVVQTYNAGKPVWSCCWCLDNPNYIYAGLINGSVYVYDTRNTSTHAHELQLLCSRKCPVASLCYIPRSTSSAFPSGGLIAGTLESGCFWEWDRDTTYNPHILPLENGCTDIQVETESRHCLVTYRPGRSRPTQRCVLMALTRTPHTDSTQLPECSCSPRQTFNAGSSCKLLTKNAVFRCPDGERTLVCAGEEATNSTLVWDANSGFLLQKLPADLPVLGISPFSVNGEHFLASLTEKMLKLYRWQ